MLFGILLPLFLQQAGSSTTPARSVSLKTNSCPILNRSEKFQGNQIKMFVSLLCLFVFNYFSKVELIAMEIPKVKYWSW